MWPGAQVSYLPAIRPALIHRRSYRLRVRPQPIAGRDTTHPVTTWLPESDKRGPVTSENSHGGAGTIAVLSHHLSQGPRDNTLPAE